MTIEQQVEEIMTEWRSHPACKKIAEYASTHWIRHKEEYVGESLLQFMETRIKKALTLTAQQAKREERLKLKNLLGNKKKLGYGAEIKKWNENIDEILSTLD